MLKTRAKNDVKLSMKPKRIHIFGFFVRLASHIENQDSGFFHLPFDFF